MQSTQYYCALTRLDEKTRHQSNQFSAPRLIVEVPGVDQHRENGAEKDNSDLGQNANAQPNDHQRQKGPHAALHSWHYERIKNVTQPPVPACYDTEWNRDDNGEQISPKKLDAADLQVMINFS